MIVKAIPNGATLRLSVGSGDVFTQPDGGFVCPRMLPEAEAGQYPVIECAGAYGS